MEKSESTQNLSSHSLRVTQSKILSICHLWKLRRNGHSSSIIGAWLWTNLCLCLKTESRYKNCLTAESCFHLHKILDSAGTRKCPWIYPQFTAHLGRNTPTPITWKGCITSFSLVRKRSNLDFDALIIYNQFKHKSYGSINLTFVWLFVYVDSKSLIPGYTTSSL